MPGGVDEVEFVGFPVARGVGHGDGMGLDGDAALALEVHVVEQLVALVALGDGAGQLEEAVGKGGFSVVDVRDDAEVADQREVARGGRRSRGARGGGGGRGGARRFVFSVEFAGHGRGGRGLDHLEILESLEFQGIRPRWLRLLSGR